MTLNALPTATATDHRLLTGRGHYAHDVSLPGMLHAVFVRSVHAQARLVNVDLAPAAACEGVLAVLDASHLAGQAMPALGKSMPWVSSLFARYKLDMNKVTYFYTRTARKEAVTVKYAIKRSNQHFSHVPYG